MSRNGANSNTRCGESLKHGGSTSFRALKNGDDAADNLEALQEVRTLAVSHAAKARLSIAPGRNAAAASTDPAVPFV